MLPFVLFLNSASGRGKSVSQGSGGYDSDSVDLHALEECPDAQYYHVQCRLGEEGGGGGGGGYERVAASRSWGLRKQAIQNWKRRPYRNSTEGEEGDVSDVGSRTTESEAEMWEQDRRVESQHGGNRGGYRLATGASLTCVGRTRRIWPRVYFVFPNVGGRTWFISQGTQFQRHKCKCHFWLVNRLKYNLGQAEKGSSVAHAAMVANVISQNVSL